MYLTDDEIEKILQDVLRDDYVDPFKDIVIEEEHVFSEEHNRKMKELFDSIIVRTPKNPTNTPKS